jgi:hypothetical protein
VRPGASKHRRARPVIAWQLSQLRTAVTISNTVAHRDGRAPIPDYAENTAFSGVTTRCRRRRLVNEWCGPALAHLPIENASGVTNRSILEQAAGMR